MGGGFSQKFGAGGGGGGSGSPMVLGSVKGKGKSREVSERRESISTESARLLSFHFDASRSFFPLSRQRLKPDLHPSLSMF